MSHSDKRGLTMNKSAGIAIICLLLIMSVPAGTKTISAQGCTSYDNDVDGYPEFDTDCSVIDCDDYDPSVNPGAAEVIGNCMDDDCNPNTSDESITIGDWHITCIDLDTSGVDTHSSLALDSSENIHISYIGREGLTYTTNSTGIWTTDVLDSSTAQMANTSIAIDSSDNVHISYWKMGEGLKYITDLYGFWVQPVILDTDGWDNSMTIDSSDNVHISYVEYMYPNFTLKYKTKINNIWVTETIDNDATNPSITRDFLDIMNIVYYDRATTSLKHATNSSGSWTMNTIDNSGDVGYGYLSSTIDSADNLHVSYFDNTNDNLKYATNESGSWATNTLEFGIGLEGTYNSIDVDSSNKVHISYIDVTNLLQYAINVSGDWLSYTIDGEFPKAYRHTSLKIDASDNVHIIYQLIYKNGGLKYATTRCTNPPLRTTEDISTYYSSLQDTYDAAVNGNTIQSVRITLNEDIIIDNDKAVTIQSGYNCNYSNIIGATTINGNVTINSGSLILADGNLIIQ